MRCADLRGVGFLTSGPGRFDAGQHREKPQADTRACLSPLTGLKGRAGRPRAEPSKMQIGIFFAPYMPLQRPT
jgi:hypothetical protein